MKNFYSLKDIIKRMKHATDWKKYLQILSLIKELHTEY